MSRRKQLKPKAMKDDLTTDDCEERPLKTCKTEDCSSDCVPIKEEESPSSPTFDCQLCEEIFDTIAALQTHTITAHVPALDRPTSTPSLVCQQCDASLPNFPSFASHMRTHLTISPTHKCNICGEMFTTLQSRQAHLVDHFITRTTRIKCASCPIGTFTDSPQLCEHASESHLKMIYACTLCDSRYENHAQFKDHFCASHSSEIFQVMCGHCELPYPSRELLAIHVQLVHDRDSLSHSLPSPFVPLFFPDLLYKNGGSPMDVNDTPKFKPLQCSVCDTKCNGEDALDEHRLREHCKVLKSDRCGICHESLSSRNHFIEHSREHSQDNQLSCIVCRQSIRSDSQLLLHAKFHLPDETEESAEKERTEERVWKCERCEEILSSFDSLESHRKEHETVRETSADPAPSSHSVSPSPSPSPAPLFPCAKCPKVFHSQYALQGHQHIHTVPHSKLHRCSLCGLSFHTSIRLDAHMKKHGNTNCCTCQICGQNFYSPEDMQSHMQMHKGNLEIGAQLCV